MNRMRQIERTVRQFACRFARNVHHDQRGSISIASIFALMLLTFVLGMVMNSGRQVDQKVKMQNAADASAYSGSVVLTRGMNTLAFTNHLLCDVFAMTAYMREGRDRSAEKLTPEILENWQRMGPVLAGSSFERFDQLSQAIEEKVPLEQEMVLTFSEWMAAISEQALPVFEDILAQEAISNFQHAVVSATPRLSQVAAEEIAQRHGQNWPQNADAHGVLWRTMVDPVGGDSESQRRTLPVVDPVYDSVPEQETYVDTARSQRESFSKRYLNDWNNERLERFDEEGKMSQFANLWRIFTCGHLEQLLEEEYPDSNLPYVIRYDEKQMDDIQQNLESDYTFVGVVYREKISNRIPGIFSNPVVADTQAFCETRMFVPTRRLLHPHYRRPEGIYLEDGYYLEWYIPREGVPIGWDLFNQNWTTQIVPATSGSIPQILSTSPKLPNVDSIKLPDLRGLDADQFRQLNHH